MRNHLFIPYSGLKVDMQICLTFEYAYYMYMLLQLKFLLAANVEVTFPPYRVGNWRGSRVTIQCFWAFRDIDGRLGVF